jgi:hypothetical protein
MGTPGKYPIIRPKKPKFISRCSDACPIKTCIAAINRNKSKLFSRDIISLFISNEGYCCLLFAFSLYQKISFLSSRFISTFLFYNFRFIFLFCQYILILFSKKISEIMAHNVPAVYDGLAARIEKCVAFLGPTNCGGGFAWE